MIRINLLREGQAKKGAGAPRPAAPAVPGEEAPLWGVYVTLVLVTVVATLGYGGWLVLQNRNMAAKIEEQKIELKKYEGAREKVAELEKRKQEYASKVDQIKQLKDQQSIPVKLMNRLVEILPEGAWYTGVTQDDKDNKSMLLKGMAKSIKTVSTLYDNAVATPEFAEVRLGEVQQQGGAEELYSFELKMQYVPAGIQPKPEAPKPQAAPARTKKKADDSGGME
ncbi:MAG: PilN domain-containing protein [Acidobacteriota bacterium]